MKRLVPTAGERHLGAGWPSDDRVSAVTPGSHSVSAVTPGGVHSLRHLGASPDTVGYDPFIESRLFSRS